MKVSLVFVILFYSTLVTYANKNDDRFVFFLHNRFLEEHKLNESHPEFGRTEYKEIIAELKKKD